MRVQGCNFRMCGDTHFHLTAQRLLLRENQMAAKRISYFLAIPENSVVQPIRLWDMLRYDRCFPMSNAPTGWTILVQPYIDGIRGGFTAGRWQSFGINQAIVATKEGGLITPFEMVSWIQQVEHAGARKNLESIVPKRNLLISQA